MVDDHDKAEQQRLSHPYLGLWKTVFKEAVWEQQHKFLHGEKNIVDKYERQQLVTEILEWRGQAFAKLGD